MSVTIDVFDIHHGVMQDYKNFVGSFIKIKDEKITTFVKKEIDAGKF